MSRPPQAGGPPPKKYKPLQTLAMAYPVDPERTQETGTLCGVDKDGRVWVRTDCLNPNSRWLEIPQPYDEV